MEIANHFCEFFTNIGPNLAKMIPPSTSSFRSFLSGSFINSIFLEPTTEHEIFEICASFRRWPSVKISPQPCEKHTRHPFWSQFGKKTIVPHSFKGTFDVTGNDAYLFTLSKDAFQVCARMVRRLAVLCVLWSQIACWRSAYCWAGGSEAACWPQFPSPCQWCSAKKLAGT